MRRPSAVVSVAVLVLAALAAVAAPAQAQRPAPGGSSWSRTEGSSWSRPAPSDPTPNRRDGSSWSRPAPSDPTPNRRDGSSWSRPTVRSTASLVAPSTAERRIATMLASRGRSAALGTTTSGMVADAATGRTVWGRSTTSMLLPASNAKVATAVAALSVYGPEHRFTTRIAAGRYASEITLVGSGDPELRTVHLDVLAARTATAVKARGLAQVDLAVDDTLFPAPTLAYGWRADYVPHEVAPVRALMVDQHEVSDTAIDAAWVFLRLLEARGVDVRVVRRAAAPAGAATLASVTGWNMTEIVRRMLLISDNDDAEHLYRLVAVRYGAVPTWTAARAYNRRVLSGLVPLSGLDLYDGSGLSRADRMSALALTRLLRVAVSPAHPELRPIVVDHGLPTAGMTGTLAARYGRFTTAPSSCARGRVYAKTGTLSDVVALSGVTTGADGRPKVFSFLVNRRAATTTVKRTVDGLAATVRGCW